MLKLFLTMAVSAATLAAATSTFAQPETPDARAKAIVDQMTPDEQLIMVKGSFGWFSKSGDAVIAAGWVPGIKRLGLPSLRESDAGMGVANLMGKRTGDVATSLPSGLAVAATWDPDIAYRGGAMIGSEARAKTFNVLLAGGVNLVRDARNGRNFEYAGEDPLLSGVMAGQAIKGVQSNHILSTVKHFAVNDQETGRNVLSSRIDEASLRESDLLAFELAIEIGQPASVMCAYNRINGVYACENDFLLNKVLKGDWAYKGWVMSDWGSVHSAALAANSGLDHQSGYTLDKKPWFGAPLKDALAGGSVSRNRIHDMNFRIVRSFYATGLMDNPVPITPQAIDYASNAKVSQEAAEAGIVVLKNKGNILPLVLGARKVAVIGGHADVGVLSGGGSSQVRPVGGPALEIVPKGAAAAFARITYFPSSPLKALEKRYPSSQFTFNNGDDVAVATALAKDTDLVIVFANQWATESEDLVNMNLPDNQDALIEALAAANKKVVVVLQTSGPVAMPWLDKVAGVVEAWYPGSNGGEAIARVLAGDVDAAGRLPVTFPTAATQLPRPEIPGLIEKKNSKGEISYGLDYGLKAFDVDYNIEGANVGYRWFEHQKLKPLFPFGYGLSYTRFTYSGLSLDPSNSLQVNFTVKNAGKRPGIATPQIYASVPGRDGVPVKRLVGWQRVTLKPGETRSITVRIDPRLLANFDVANQRWKVAAGAYHLVLGKSSADSSTTTTVQLSELSIAP